MEPRSAGGGKEDRLEGRNAWADRSRLVSARGVTSLPCSSRRVRRCSPSRAKLLLRRLDFLVLLRVLGVDAWGAAAEVPRAPAPALAPARLSLRCPGGPETDALGALCVHRAAGAPARSRQAVQLCIKRTRTSASLSERGAALPPPAPPWLAICSWAWRCASASALVSCALIQADVASCNGAHRSSIRPSRTASTMFCTLPAGGSAPWTRSRLLTPPEFTVMPASLSLSTLCE